MGFLYVSVLFISELLSSIFLHRYYHRGWRCAIHVFISIHSLSLSPSYCFFVWEKVNISCWLDLVMLICVWFLISGSICVNYGNLQEIVVTFSSSTTQHDKWWDCQFDVSRYSTIHSNIALSSSTLVIAHPIHW
jgi:hypothetical protein